MRLIPGIDNGAFDHGIQANFGLKEIGPLGDLVGDRVCAVLCNTIARPTEGLARDQKRRHLVDNGLERNTPIEQIVLMIPIAVALLVAIVFVDNETPAGRQELIGSEQAAVYNTLSSFFIAHHVQYIGAFRGTKLGMGMIDIIARPIRQNLIDSNVFLRTEDVIVVVVELKTPRIHQWIFLIVVPQ